MVHVAGMGEQRNAEREYLEERGMAAKATSQRIFKNVL
jgi:hypothetical protein